jgi:hypothetical protein
MVACITRIQSSLNFLLNQIFICYSHSQILDLSHMLKLFLCYSYIQILVCILVPRHQHVLSFL